MPRPVLIAAAVGALAACAAVVCGRPSHRAGGSSSGSMFGNAPARRVAPTPVARAPQSMVESRSAAVRALDRNRDGWVSRAEWRGSTTAFRRLDRNGDGKVRVGPAVKTARPPAKTPPRQPTPTVRKPTPTGVALTGSR
jgi:hypothetical protein